MGGTSTGEPTWHIARRCETGGCVEVGILGESVMIRSTADPEGVCVTISRNEWLVFVAGVKDGDFDGL